MGCTHCTMGLLGGSRDPKWQMVIDISLKTGKFLTLGVFLSRQMFPCVTCPKFHLFRIAIWLFPLDYNPIIRNHPMSMHSSDPRYTTWRVGGLAIKPTQQWKKHSARKYVIDIPYSLCLIYWLLFLCQWYILICLSGNQAIGIKTGGVEALRDGKSLHISGHVKAVQYHGINDTVNDRPHIVVLFQAVRIVQWQFLLFWPVQKWP